MEITEYIMQKISSGEWPVDYMIPKEVQLCEQFNVSRPTVRTAVLNLVQDGYLRRVKGKGTYVTAPKVLEQTTVFLESFFNEMHLRGQEVSTEVLEFRLMMAEKELKQRLETENSEIIKLSRLRYIKDSFGEGPIVLTTTYFTGDNNYLFKYNFEEVSLRSVLNENGKSRKYFEKELIAVTVSARESRFLGAPEGSLAMRITSLSRDKKGNVVEFSESLYPMDRNQFILKLQL